MDYAKSKGIEVGGYVRNRDSVSVRVRVQVDYAKAKGIEGGGYVKK